MFTSREIAREMGEDASAVRAIFSGIDQAKIFEAAKKRVAYEIWDGSSDIQGIPATHWISTGELPSGGKMYLIKDVESNLVIKAQPHAPGGIGRAPMTEAQAIAFAVAELNQIALSLAKQEVIKAVDLALDAQA